MADSSSHHSDRNPTRCLVLGGSGALGRTVCRMLARQGGRVAFTWHTAERIASELAEQLPGGMALALDARRIPEIEGLVDRVADSFGGIDVLVHCIATGAKTENRDPESHQQIEHIDEAAWDEMIAVNTKSALFAARRVLRFMRNGSGGNLVLTGSFDGVKPAPSPIHYAASKSALRGMVTSMAKEFGQYGVCVNMVAPGVLEDGLSRLLPDHLLDEYKKHCGLKRVGRLCEIASLITWLALDNTYVTGQTILVDGGV